MDTVKSVHGQAREMVAGSLVNEFGPLDTDSAITLLDERDLALVGGGDGTPSWP